MPVSGIPKDWEQKKGFGRRHGCRILRPKTFIYRCARQPPSWYFLFLVLFVCNMARSGQTSAVMKMGYFLNLEILM